MEEEIEDIVGDVKYTDSQKSVTASHVYSNDFTDSNSDKNTSSGKETYVLDYDDSDDSEESYKLTLSPSAINLLDSQTIIPVPKLQQDATVQATISTINKAAITNINCSITAQETYTQTSKTIIQLAEIEGSTNNNDNRSLQTQTSYLSITENKTVQYRIEYTGDETNLRTINQSMLDYNPALNTALEDGSSKFPASDTDNDKPDSRSGTSIDEHVLRIIDSNDDIINDDLIENTSENSMYEESDIEEDSLMEFIHPEQPKKAIDSKSDVSETLSKSTDNEVEKLYTKLSNALEMAPQDRCDELEFRRFSTLTPLTEESTIKKESLVNIIPTATNFTPAEHDKDFLFTSKNGIKVKTLTGDNDVLKYQKESCSLPPIQKNLSCPNSPHLSLLFNVQPSNKSLNKAGTLSCLFEGQGQPLWDGWDVRKRELASGESHLISGKSDFVQLPAIQLEGNRVQPHSARKTKDHPKGDAPRQGTSSPEAPRLPISIRDKIRELKMCERNSYKTRGKFFLSRTAMSRSCSPGSETSPERGERCDAVEKGGDMLSVELIKRLRSSSWLEIADTLESVPKSLEKFWDSLTEHRIADLIRQVLAHIESPRTQVACSACNTIAAILKNTNYTKKPDFYEAVTILLIKTGSFNRALRRAANMALDEVVCGVEVSHAITALCVHGVQHKNPLVRCASARLLVVCCALGGGGRQLLRARPSAAVSARRHALVALSALLDDKSTDTRKYAERLYCMLRPLDNFEAFYLNDVSVEVAARQMRKYDRLLMASPPEKRAR